MESEEHMDTTCRISTWLEIAVAPAWRRDQFEISMHPVSDCSTDCFVLFMDDKVVCSGNGQPTVFKGESSAKRFLQLVNISDYVVGAPCPIGNHGFLGACCLCVQADGRLLTCPRSEAREQMPALAC